VWSSPNPAVGCAIVKSNEVLATGFTHPTGQAHAEVHALSQVADATGSTVFVTLEPCAHIGLTPPCTQTLIDAGIARVVIACIDPDERVAGRGVEQLRAAGIDVTLGVCEAEAADELAGFFLRLKRGYGRVTVKMAMSADGRTAMASGESQWITGEEARADVQAWRACSDVIVTASGTVSADDCSLTLRPCDNRLDSDDWERAMMRPTPRAVIDTNARTPASANVVAGVTPTTLFTSEGASLDSSMPGNVFQVPIASSAGGLDVRQALIKLGE
jgi:diaminohydroxyphosphoribosylaminopyrimidine deaminase/5-amino-6-(5-phosphoribosylamino)uracil reductase